MNTSSDRKDLILAILFVAISAFSLIVGILAGRGAHVLAWTLGLLFGVGYLIYVLRSRRSRTGKR